MSSKRYPEEFMIEAVRQVTDRGYSVADVTGLLDLTTHSLYARLKKYGPDANRHRTKAEEQAEINRLKKELKRVTEERGILKKWRRTSQVTPSEVRIYQSTVQLDVSQTTLRTA